MKYFLVALISIYLTMMWMDYKHQPLTIVDTYQTKSLGHIDVPDDEQQPLVTGGAPIFDPEKIEIVREGKCLNEGKPSRKVYCQTIVID